MKLYFENRESARQFAKKSPAYKVRDCKDNPSVNGRRWAVSFAIQRQSSKAA